MADYYAYVHARPESVDAAGIFYVGKGKGDRCYDFKRRGQNPYYANVVEKNGSPLVGKLDCSSESIAFDLERGLIKCLRRMGVALTNLSDGGEGQSGYKFSEEFKAKHPSKRPEARAKASEKTKVQFSKEGAKDKFLGVNNSSKRPEVREKMSASASALVKSGKHHFITNSPMRTEHGKAAMTRSHQERFAAGTHHLMNNNPAKSPEFREARRLSFTGDRNPMRNPEVVAKRINPSSIPAVATARGLKLKGRICINDGVRYIRIHPEDVESWLAKGWKKGRV